MSEKKEVAASSSSGGEETKVKVKIRKWMPVAIWKFGGSMDHCPVCQNNLAIRCIECQVDETRKCGLSYGVCGHIFHTCCIGGWAQTGKAGGAEIRCPLCSHPWEL